MGEQMTNKLVNTQQKKKDDQKKKEQKDANPLIIPHMNPRPNPLLIGGGHINPPYGGGFNGDMDPFVGGGGGNLMGPQQIWQQQQQRNNQNRYDPNNPNGNRPPMVPDGARFDPYGPGPGIGRGRRDLGGFGHPDLGGFGGMGGGFGGFM